MILNGRPLRAFLFVVASIGLCFGEIPVRYSGSYSLSIELTRSERSQAEAKAKVTIDAVLPAGQGTVLVPLPFSIERSSSVIIEGHATSNSVLHGDIWPERQYSVIMFALGNQATTIRATVQGIAFPLDDSVQSESGKAVQFLIHRAFVAAIANFPGVPLMGLSEMHFQPVSLGETTPPSTAENARDRLIRFPIQDMPATDVTLYLRSTTALYGLYIMLGLFGVILGLVGSPKIPQNRAGLVFIIGTFGFLVLAFVFFGLLTPEQRMLDTGQVIKQQTSL